MHIELIHNMFRHIPIIFFLMLLQCKYTTFFYCREKKMIFFFFSERVFDEVDKERQDTPLPFYTLLFISDKANQTDGIS